MGAEMMSPKVKRVRAYFAPVNRQLRQATIFDPAQSGTFDLDAPPSPWYDLGWIDGFERSSSVGIAPLRAGAPALAEAQARTEAEATLRFTFQTWGKLQLALAVGTQQMNLLPVEADAMAAGSGGACLPAVPLLAGSTATSIQLGDAASAFTAGMTVVVDLDYVAGSTGFVGSGVSGAYVKGSLTDVNYIRRVSLNVGRVMTASDGVLTLSSPLAAGDPAPGMKISPVLGFCDREGSTFFQEWSGLFVCEGQQGERVLWHYPRLQSMAGIAEQTTKEHGSFRTLQLSGAYRALPVTDAADGERVLCFRSFLPK